MNQTHEQVAYPRAVHRAVEQGILAMQHYQLQGSLTEIMPTARLCRVVMLNNVSGEGSLIFGGPFGGIITGSPRKRAEDPAAGSGRVRDRTKSRGRARVPLAACRRAGRSGSFLSIRGRARERSR